MTATHLSSVRLPGGKKFERDTLTPAGLGTFLMGSYHVRASFPGQICASQMPSDAYRFALDPMVYASKTTAVATWAKNLTLDKLESALKDILIESLNSSQARLFTAWEALHSLHFLNDSKT
jgi:hypothetical protein